jgi:hypothetical protein
VVFVLELRADGRFGYEKLPLHWSESERRFPFLMPTNRKLKSIAGAPYPDLVKTVPHVAFEVDDLIAAIRDQKVIIEPNSPSNGVMVAFIEVNGAPVELMQIDHSLRKDL